MTNPEQPAVTGSLAVFRAAELGPEQHGRRIRFQHEDRAVHGILGSTAAGLSTELITIVLDLPRRLHQVPVETEVTVITETAAEAVAAEKALGEDQP